MSDPVLEPLVPIVDKVEIYRGKDRLWYWRARAKNGEKIASGEGYKNHGDCYDVPLRMSAGFPNAKFVDEAETDAP